MECNLKFASFNCNGFKNRNYDYIKDISKNCDIILLQETWLYNFEHTNFSSVIPKCNYHAVSGMDESQVTRVGRPFGGCAILWHRSLLMTFTPVATSSKRLCAVNIMAENINIILVNV